MTTEQWLRVFSEAEALGVLQLHLTGGEPLARRDLEALVAGARSLGLFTNLITSGVPLVRARLAALKDAGLDAVQLSVQGVDAGEFGTASPASNASTQSWWWRDGCASSTCRSR